MAPTPAIQAQDAQAAASLPSDALAQHEALPRGCESFQVYDEHGRIWPPGFVSQLCGNGPLSMLNANHLASARAKEAREQAAREGRGWANGTLESLAKPDYTPGPRPVMNAKPFKFKPGSIPEQVYIILRDQGPKTTPEIRAALRLKRYELKPYLTPAIRAGVIVSRRVEANTNVYELGRTLEVAA